jgi:hypothetical protein
MVHTGLPDQGINVISQLISYLINLPTPSTSPMALALNGSSALLAELGDTVTAVSLVSTRNQDGDPPYCRFYDNGSRSNDAMFLGGSYQELQIMVVECAAYGPTDSIAEQRASYLKRAVRGKILSLIGTFHSGVPGPATDLTGSSATDNIAAVTILPGLDEPVISGPGDNPAKPSFTCIRKLQVGVRVHFGKP